tara:strand:+ start:3998 stop:4240 length:243 start_codon:yes stop_codon:yes gene_type:complete
MGLLNSFTIVELSSALVAVIGVVSMCCKSNLQQIQRSRCENINCCCGFFKCRRNIEGLPPINNESEEEEEKEEEKNDEKV